MSFYNLTPASVLLLITMLAGCGNKTWLVPVQRLAPESIDDLRYTLGESGVTLQWSYPTKMENGEVLQAVESFDVYRSGIPAEEYCQGCPVRFEEPLAIDGGRLDKPGETRTALYTDTDMKKEYHYHYKVRSRSSRWYPSGDSNIVSFVWTGALEAPEDFKTQGQP